MPKARIVIVEDEVIIARDIQRTLIRLGYEVPALAISAEDALAYVASMRPDLVLMDIHLSGKTDGITAAAQIQNISALPVIYLTAHSDEATLRRASVTGPYGYILKPFEERELEIAVDIALYRHGIESKLRHMERWLSTTLKSIGDAIVVTGTDGSISFMNRTAEGLTGWDEAQALGRRFDEVLPLVHEHSRAPLESPVERVLREQRVLELDSNTILIARNGTEMPVDDSAAPIRDDHGHITGVVVIFRDITARKQVEQQLRHIAMHDALTGLPNRALLMDRMAHAFDRARRHAHYRFAVLYLDLDRFKIINDSLGHLFGDQVLIVIARLLESGLRAEDTVARVGGDEFVVLMDDISGVRDALLVADRIHQALLSPIHVDEHEIYTAASIGIVLSGPNYQQPNDILRDADAALYQAKALGKGRYVLFDIDLHDRAMRLLRMENDLRRALARAEFRIHYQPIIALENGRVHGFEALIRWQHPERGLLMPGEFLALAEETGTLVAISEWMLREACKQIVAWQSQHPQNADLTISINLSNSQFWQPDLPMQVTRVLAETKIRPSRLCLEITESVIGERSAAIAALERLHLLGVQLHVDDFGTGYSSLSMLHNMPIDTLKIDRSFVQSLDPAQANESAIVRTIILLAQALRLAVIAEGIETAEHATYLKGLGCEYGQGYWFSRPLTPEAAATLLASAP
jgi:diguanylate cyclase (GGDEF)-like protein/PAS domain S-box-containing protein